jgi:Protein of unknown function (DUF3617)
MNNPRRTHSFPSWISLAVLAFPFAAAAQTPAPPAGLSETPPVTMGLWQTETTSTVTGVEGTPMAAMATAMGRGHVVQSCLTSDRWKSDIQGFNAKQQHGCTLSNLHQDSQQVSFDQTCGPTTSSHVDILIDSAEHTHGTVIVKVSNPSLPQPMTITVNMISQYLGSACGDVKPGEGRIVK